MLKAAKLGNVKLGHIYTKNRIQSKSAKVLT